MTFLFNNAQAYIWWLLLVGVIVSSVSWFIGRVLNKRNVVVWRTPADIWDFYLSRGKRDYRLLHMWWWALMLLLSVSVILMSIAAYLVNQTASDAAGWSSGIDVELVVFIVHVALYPFAFFMYFTMGYRGAGSVLYFASWGFLFAATILFGLRRALAGYLLIYPLLFHTLFFVNLAVTAWKWRGQDPRAHVAASSSSSK